MLISLNWLKEYLKGALPDDPAELGNQLTMSTVEVENISRQGTGLEKIVVGQIKEILKHPKADKLSICQVDVGAEKYLQIVCGGQNIYKNMRVAVSLVGSKVFWHGQKTLQKIELTKIRGVESEGMICGATEIGLSDFFPAADILDLNAYQTKNGAPLGEVLNLDDIIFEIENKSITNRPDLWGHYGIAREIAALYKLTLKPLVINENKNKKNLKLKIEIDNDDDCPKYLGVVISNIHIGESPSWLKNKLLAVGQRPINNVVDITNFIMLELGQPLHAFDYDKVKGGKIIVKRSSSRQNFTTLDNQQRKLSSEVLMINDSERPLAIAGIMGGKDSEISEKTKNIIIESANFNPNLIRRGELFLGLRTDASSRFEKGLDPELTRLALDRAITLIKEIIPESEISSDVADVFKSRPLNRVIEVELNTIQKRIGEAIPLKEIKEILEALSFTVNSKKELMQVTVPSFRSGRDINLPEDLVEEVARIYGYNRIKAELPVVSLNSPDLNWERKHERLIKNYLTLGSQFCEVYNYSMVSIEDAKRMALKENDFFHLKNSISSDQTLLRTSLIINLLKNAEHNLKYFTDFRIFELGRIFKKKSGDDFRDFEKNYTLPQQEKHLGGLVVGEKDSFLAAKGAITDLLDKLNVKFELSKDDNYLPWAELGQTLKIIINDQIAGVLGEIKKSVKDAFNLQTAVAFFDFNLTKLIKIIGSEKKFKPLQKYPEVIKDLSVILAEDILWEDLEKEILNASPKISKIELFDVYQSVKLGQAKKSLAFHLTFYNPERTLISNEVDQEIQKIIDIMENKFQATVRQA